MNAVSIKDLKNTTAIVQHLLETDPETRDSDMLLYYKVLWLYERVTGNDITKKSLKYALTEGLTGGNFPKYETVSRARRKVQRKHPELKARAEVQDIRDYNEQVFTQYAVSDYTM